VKNNILKRLRNDPDLKNHTFDLTEDLQLIIDGELATLNWSEENEVSIKDTTLGKIGEDLLYSLFKQDVEDYIQRQRI